MPEQAEPGAQPRAEPRHSHGAQVDAVLGDRKPSLEDIQALRFTTRVLNESMRLYPQPPVLIRRALQDDVLAGYKVRCRYGSTGAFILLIPGD